MFSTRRAPPSSYKVESFSSKYGAGKSSSKKRSFREHSAAASRKFERATSSRPENSPGGSPQLTSQIVTLVVGPEQRLFAAHEDVLSLSPFFQAALKGQFLESSTKKVVLPEEEPVILSAVLEYMYKGDYYPRLLHNKRKDTWELEDGGATGTPGGKQKSTDCAADRYGLDELKRLALRKQGLQGGIQCSMILSSARYAYANTPDNDSKLRAHYLALIIRSRGTFKRSGTMQAEMEAGGTLFFDLFVAMCNHMTREPGDAAK
ncbi:MAG: hypothetical protein Q9227_000471 [Pyrenula ochraceoflavens]